MSKCLPELHGGKRGDQALLGAQAATSEEGWGVAMAIFGHSALPDFMNKVGQFNIFNDLADHEVNRRLVLNNVVSAYINLLPRPY